VVGTDTSDDVAVLQLQGASGLDTVTTDSAGVGVGDAVTVVGDGNGTVDHLSSATGSVLATQQSITTQSEGDASGEALSGLIQISSDVVSGYRGGATYDADGQVVGMTTAASSGGDTGPRSPGCTTALPPHGRASPRATRSPPSAAYG